MLAGETTPRGEGLINMDDSLSISYAVVTVYYYVYLIETL